jgi:hypothetical protein
MRSKSCDTKEDSNYDHRPGVRGRDGRRASALAAASSSARSPEPALPYQARCSRCWAPGSAEPHLQHLQLREPPPGRAEGVLLRRHEHNRQRDRRARRRPDRLHHHLCRHELTPSGHDRMNADAHPLQKATNDDDLADRARRCSGRPRPAISPTGHPVSPRHRIPVGHVHRVVGWFILGVLAGFYAAANIVAGVAAALAHYRSGPRNRHCLT